MKQSDEHQISVFNENTEFIWFTANELNDEIINSCDGALFIMSAAEGLGPELIEAWEFSIDHDLPRHLLVLENYRSFADFDEVMAIAKRVLQPDIAARYLPMADDSASSMAGIYDLLTATVWDYSSGKRQLKEPDVEHIQLTAEDRENLREQIAIQSFRDEMLDMHQSGLSVEQQKYVAAWLPEFITSASPLELGKGAEIIQEWVASLPQRWTPISPDEQSVLDQQRYGIGISDGVARMWGASKTNLQIRPFNDPSAPAAISPAADEFSSILLDSRIRQNDVICHENENLVLIAPLL